MLKLEWPDQGKSLTWLVKIAIEKLGTHDGIGRVAVASRSKHRVNKNLAPVALKCLELNCLNASSTLLE